MSNGGERQRNWKGQAERGEAPIRHRWQAETELGQTSGVYAPARALRRFLAFLLILFIGMLGGFVYLLLHAPAKTPVISVGATNYVWPLPPNAWAKEDIEFFGALHGKIIQWKDSSRAWQSKSSALDDLRTQLRDAAPLARRAGALILYLNMHGAVNEEGEACLIPPGASPLTTTQWIAIEDLGEVIRANVPAGVKVLLVLDCVHQRVNWNMAQLNNTFIDRVEAWGARSRPDPLLVITSSSADEQSWAGPDLHASIFGREFLAGLAGAADRKAADGLPSSGNGDGSVSVRELINYLATHVHGWSQSHRGTGQVPKSIPQTFDDFRIGWSLKSGELDRQIAIMQRNDVAVARPSSEELAELWRNLDSLRELGAYRYDPKGWAELEHKLLWLDQLAISGSAYTELASKQVYPLLSKRLQSALQRAKELSTTNNELPKLAILQETVEPSQVGTQLPSLALLEYTGEVSTNTATALRRRLLGATGADPSEPLSQMIASLGLGPEIGSCNELNFAGLARKYDSLQAWPDRSDVQQLFELRDQCEQMAIFGDVRGHRWRRPALHVADQARRHAEDQLLHGPSGMLRIGEERSPWEAMRNALQGSDRDSASFGSLSILEWELRDRGLAQVSHLAAWICDPDTEMENLGQWKGTDPLTDPSAATAVSFLEGKSIHADPFLREQMAIQQLKRWMSGLHELTELLGSVSEEGQGNRERLRQVAEQVARDEESLMALLADHQQRALLAAPGTSPTIRAMDGMLRLPFVPIEQRLALLKKRDQQLRESAQRSGRSDGEEPKQGLASVVDLFRSKVSATKGGSEGVEGGAAIKRTRFADRMRNWDTHPLGELLQLKGRLSIETLLSSGTDAKLSDADRELNALDLANTQLRRYFQSTLSFSPTRLVDWLRSSGAEQIVAPESNDWVQAVASEHIERILASVSPVPFEANASRNFRTMAFKDLLLWYANRTTDDFYAEGTEGVKGNGGTESYFERAAQRTLEFAATLSPNWVGADALAKNVRARLQLLGPLARNGLKASVKLGAPMPQSNQTPFDVSVQQTVTSVPSGSGWTMPFPEGEATILVRSPHGIVPNMRGSISMPVPSQPQTIGILCPTLDRSMAHEAVVVYRGHEFSAPMFVGQGIVVDFKPNRYDWGELILFGDRQRQPSALFVLDCSWSMGEEIPVEAIELRSQSRLELAKENILRMLTQIAARPDARVGVRLFGHRLGWSRPIDDKTGETKGKPQILVQPKYPESIPDDLVPSRDVEAILPLGRFTPEMVGGVASKLAKIVPWGQSPLYLSIIQSFRDFDNDNDATAKSIVVITDGDNFQFNASGRPGGEPGISTSMEDVIRAWNSNQIPLFILGVGISDKETPNARKNLMALAEKTKGKYYDIENGSDLLRALSEQLSMGVYRVSPSEPSKRSSNAAGVVEAKLNSPVEFKRLSRPASYDIAFQSIHKSLEFKGGESLEMYLREDGQDIVSKPYDRASPRAATLVRNGDSGRLIARVHRPTPSQNGVLFPISIQDPENHYTPRPQQLWIEIVPVIANVDQPRQTYLFYDANYEAKKPVPMVSWLATNWPTAATMADVRLWAKYEPTPNLQTIPIPQIQLDPQRFAEGIEVNGIDGVQLRINIIERRPEAEGIEIQVTELHGDRSRGVGAIRVQLETDESMLPDRITRRFESANRMAVHTFELNAALGRSILRSPSARLTIQSRAAAHEGAWQLQAGQPIRVDVGSVPETLPLIGLPSNIKQSR